MSFEYGRAGFFQDKVLFDFGMLIVMAVAFRVLAYLSLLLKTLKRK